MTVFWIVYLPYLIGGTFLILGLSIFVVESIKDDIAWKKYEDAYSKWVKSNRKGEIPKYDDYK